MRNIKSKIAVAFVSFILAFSQIACGKDKIEKSIGTFVRAVKSARQITTEQHEYGHLTDAEYVLRLKAFLKVYETTDILGDRLVAFGEINATNKVEVLALIKDVNASLIELAKTGNLGIKNDKAKAEFVRWALVASVTLSGIQAAVAASTKPVPTAELKIENL